jgi:protein SCO1/2
MRHLQLTCKLILPILCVALTARAQTEDRPKMNLGEKQTEPEPQERITMTPPDLKDVGVTERLDATVPMDLEFVDETGKHVRLGDYFDGEHPVILNLGYYRCPMLCGLVLNGLVDAMREMDWSPQKEFRIVTVSIDPKETPALAKLKKQNYMKAYDRPGAGAGWCFLTGKPEPIKTLTETVGFDYKWNERNQQYAHAAVLVVCTPKGRVSRYLYGVKFEPKTVRLSLVEASEGKIGSTVDKVLLYCFHYDAAERRYSLAAMNVMRAGGALTLVILAAFLFPAWIRGSRRKKRAAIAAQAGETQQQ